MEEKKLTDEEIVKALECCLDSEEDKCGECPYHKKKIKCYFGRHEHDCFDYIRRLQAKIAEYERKLDDGELVSKDWHDEQVGHLEEEIERLQSENEKPKRKKILANRVYSDETLKRWKKEDLIEQIRILEHNWVATEESLDIQAKNCEMLLKQKEKDTAKEIFDKIFEVLCCFTTQGKSKEYAEGFIECLEEVDKRIQTLAKEKYGVVE